MEPFLQAIEIGGTIDEEQNLHLDHPLPVSGPARVRVIVLLAEDSDISEREWLAAHARNPAFADLADPAEDIYTLDDGNPFIGSGV